MRTEVLGVVKQCTFILPWYLSKNTSKELLWLLLETCIPLRSAGITTVDPLVANTWFMWCRDGFQGLLHTRQELYQQLHPQPRNWVTVIFQLCSSVTESGMISIHPLNICWLTTCIPSHLKMERTHFTKLSSDLHMWFMACAWENLKNNNAGSQSLSELKCIKPVLVYSDYWNSRVSSDI